VVSDDEDDEVDGDGDGEVDGEVDHGGGSGKGSSGVGFGFGSGMAKRAVVEMDSGAAGRAKKRRGDTLSVPSPNCSTRLMIWCFRLLRNVLDPEQARRFDAFSTAVIPKQAMTRVRDIPCLLSSGFFFSPSLLGTCRRNCPSHFPHHAHVRRPITDARTA